jgi:hypothetical protein
LPGIYNPSAGARVIYKVMMETRETSCTESGDPYRRFPGELELTIDHIQFFRNTGALTHACCITKKEVKIGNESCFSLNWKNILLLLTLNRSSF